MEVEPIKPCLAAWWGRQCIYPAGHAAQHLYSGAVGSVAADAPAAFVKHDQQKLRYDLIDPSALAGLAAVLTFGAAKYSPDNWRLTPASEYRERWGNALMRHFEAWRRGEDLDDETAMPHLAHAFCCLMVLLALSAKGFDWNRALIVALKKKDKP